MASFYELLNQAHESNVRRGFHNSRSPSERDDRSSLDSQHSGTVTNSGGQSLPKRHMEKENRDGSLMKVTRSKSNGSDAEDEGKEDEYMYGNASVEANIARKRTEPQHSTHYQDVPNGNHFGNLGAELHSLKRQLALNQTTMNRAMK